MKVSKRVESWKLSSRRKCFDPGLETDVRRLESITADLGQLRHLSFRQERVRRLERRGVGRVGRCDGDGDVLKESHHVLGAGRGDVEGDREQGPLCF